MNEEGKAEVINTIFQVLGIISIFFAGYILQELFTLAVFLFICGIIIIQLNIVFDKEMLQVSAVFDEKGEKEE